MATDIEIITTTLAEFDKVGAGLAILRKNYEGMLFDVETHEGMEMAKAARKVIRQPRYDIEKLRKDAKAPLLAVGRKLDEEAKRITAELMKLEDPIDQQIKTEEARVERERQAKIDAEAKRVTDIQARIENIRQMPVRASGKPSAIVASIQVDAAGIVIDDSFAEFAEQASSALAQTVAALAGLHAVAVAAEAEAARVAAEREELAKLREAQAKRDEEERARQAEEDRKAREQHERERAEQEAALQEERNKLAAERAEQERLAQIERARVAEEDRQRREESAREQARLDAEREQLRREQEVLRAPPAVAAEPHPSLQATNGRPSDIELVAVIAHYFGVQQSTARAWLADFGTAKAA